jgi:Uma2 family endonuclease
MVAAVPLQPVAPPAEQRILLNASWKEYVLLRDLLDGPAVRMTYRRGALEIMSPSPEHELWKTNLARFVELYAYKLGVDLRGYGSTTFKREAKELGAEPDECYLIGKKLVDYPEIVIEVVRTSPLVDKLDIYLAFGVREVWVFRDRAFTLYRLAPGGSRYELATASDLLPGLDFARLAHFITREDTNQALREFEATLPHPGS